MDIRDHWQWNTADINPGPEIETKGIHQGHQGQLFIEIYQGHRDQLTQNRGEIKHTIVQEVTIDQEIEDKMNVDNIDLGKEMMN